MTEHILDDLGVEEQVQHHAKVLQHKDVRLLFDHLYKSHIFNWDQDKSSNHLVVDLYRVGLHRLSGSDGGHAKHLRRHVLRSRTSHNIEVPLTSEVPLESVSNQVHQESEIEELERLNYELEKDNECPELTPWNN